jgi:hypothetical protein
MAMTELDHRLSSLHATVQEHVVDDFEGVLARYRRRRSRQLAASVLVSALVIGGGAVAYTTLTGGSVDSVQVGDANDSEEQGGSQLQQERQRFLTWMGERYPSVPITHDIWNGPYYREFLASRGALLVTVEGVIEGDTGKWLAPAGSSLFPSDGFRAPPGSVEQCRANPTSSHECGKWLAIADGNFHPKGGYPVERGGFAGAVFYTEEQIHDAVVAAGYAYRPRTPEQGPCPEQFSYSLQSERDGQANPLDAAIWFAKYSGRIPRSIEGWTAHDVSHGEAIVTNGTLALHTVQGPDATWQVDSGSCG